MANGFSLGVLQMIREITKQATPQDKLEPVGLYGMLETAMSPGVIMNDTGTGHTKQVTVKYKQRFTPSQVGSVDTCDITNTQPYLETQVSVANFKMLPIHVEDIVIAQMDEYASRMVATGTAPITPMMFEFYDSIMTGASAISQAINTDLGALAAAAVGVNRSTGVNTATTINIPVNTVNNRLGDGVNRIKSDFLLNGFSGRPIVVGGGLMYDWMLNQPAKSADQSGLDSRIQAAGFDFWTDYTLGAGALGGANEVLVYEKDAIQLVTWLRNRGSFAGTKGGSTFGIISLPMNAGNGTVKMVPYDFQLKYNDCAEEFGYVDGESGVLVQRGWNIMISKHFGLFTIPSNAYRASDVLTGNRGSLLYDITNECDVCEEEGV